MGKKYDFGYIVIGSGPAGSAAALELAGHKKKVAIVEGHFFGGSNLNTRDIPYAVALDFSHTYHKILSFPELKSQNLQPNIPTIAARQLKTVIEMGGNNKKVYEDAGITCIKGYAIFADKHTIIVNEQKYTTECFIIATGSHLKTLEISGTNTVNYLSPETAIKIHHLPDVVAVVGGGSSGCEIAEYFAELGSKVIILETAAHLLPREDEEIGTDMTNYFTQKLGITVLPNSHVVALEEDDISKRVIFRSENTEKMIRVNCIVLATGAEPNLNLNLDNAGVKYKNSGITVDKCFQTSAKHIYAIGDCIGSESSTERAHQEGLAVANNLINHSKTPINYKGFVRFTSTYPEIVTIGLNEYDLIKRDRKYKKVIVKLADLPSAHVDGLEHGFVKLIADKANHIIGATIVAPHASLMAPEIAIVIRHGLTAVELASTPHAKNTYAYAIRLAAKEILNKKK
ncbi:NAD(P)/FAD-dependent oxidoreductase [Candidatus Saccharibacteria bacterium]|nr:NAD(P)/FAD-dependent oxidoreductase [Candidatus Saccharibacteria bacterium]